VKRERLGESGDQRQVNRAEDLVGSAAALSGGGSFGNFAILDTVSYFSFRSNVAQRQGENSYAMEQLWSKTSTRRP
jgi:hypothetical protein